MSLRSRHVALRAASVLSLILVLASAPACAGGSTAKGDVLILETREGEIAIQLFPKDAPRTVENIRKLVSEGFYDGLTFHRIRPGFVIQGGDPNSRNENPFDDGRGGPPYKVPGEIGRPHVKGAVAMAREPDSVNPKRESNGSQFYIALRDLPTWTAPTPCSARCSRAGTRSTVSWRSRRSRGSLGWWMTTIPASSPASVTPGWNTLGVEEPQQESPPRVRRPRPTERVSRRQEPADGIRGPVATRARSASRSSSRAPRTSP
jgi:cyclophilin family peptidyl-prolyl cis-trans isomerase